ncbi:hypothetical protein [Pseudomonas sp. C2B4]|uniref:hypothetical protein n=1 Tax=Pseudomonas sp. C2B4 TaxID=2735270 RepID=UPI0015868FE5|nr:hypothetical protein [Pseudomonas sp. C2B4]NUU37834.1 hypothetical protein [Pseudomonas sp. C2B4]
MPAKLADHLWEKIIERDALAIRTLREKIAAVQQLEALIILKESQEIACVVMRNGLIEHALKRCLENLEGSEAVTEQDVWVFYEYASYVAKHAEKLEYEEE